MLRKNVRLRKEYLLRKGLEAQEEAILEKKRRLKEAIEEGKPIPSDLRGSGIEGSLRPRLDLEDDRTLGIAKGGIEGVAEVEAPSPDDEYACAGVVDPKVVITTSRDPSSRLLQFAKEMTLLIPSSQRINRGSYVIKDVVDVCRKNEVSDLILLHEHRGQPDCMVVCHFPNGPTAYFSLSEVILRHDLPEKPHQLSEAAPHLIFHNFSSSLGKRVSNILKYLYPPPRPTSQRVLCFINQDDRIIFRHHVWQTGNENAKEIEAKLKLPKKQERVARREKTLELSSEGASDSSGITLNEVGPRFYLKPFRIELGTIEMKDVDIEWTLRPYFNKPRAALS